VKSDELYQEVLLQHSRHPRNHGALEHATHRAEGYNALCGDEVTVEAIINDGVVESIQFQASACAICTASASIMTCEAMKLPEPDVIGLAQTFRKLATDGAADCSIEGRPALDVMGTIHRFPQRVKCATLPWETLTAALHSGKLAG
jgi:nitrogen fixation NifU-like protein